MRPLLVFFTLSLITCRTREDVPPITDGSVADLRGDLAVGEMSSNPLCDEVNGVRGGAHLRCGGSDCFSSVCCVDSASGKQTCESKCATGLNEFSCDDPQDCMGAACCFNHEGPPPFRAVCTNGFCNGLEVCHKTSDCPPGLGLMCRKMTGFPDGTGACQPPC